MAANHAETLMVGNLEADFPNVPLVQIFQNFHNFVVKHITKTYLYNFDPLKPHFYILKLGFTWVYIIFLI